MKKLIIFILMFSFFNIFNPLHAEEMPINDPLYSDITNTVLSYFTALKDGDINTIKVYISLDIYKKNKALLEQNEKYPEFLRNYYQGAEFEVAKVEKIDDNIIVTVVIKLAKNSLSVISLRLVKESSQGETTNQTWKIDGDTQTRS